MTNLLILPNTYFFQITIVNQEKNSGEPTIKKYINSEPQRNKMKDRL